MDAAARERVERDMREQAIAGLRAAAEQVAERAIGYMPVGDPQEDPDPTTSLAGRTRIEEQADSVLVIIDTEYAQVQHWAKTYKHPRGGEDRFLERALLEVAPGLDEIVANTPRTFRGRF